MMDAVFILGRMNSRSGMLSPGAIERVEKGTSVFRKKRAKYLITCGGKGRFNKSRWNHCELLRRYAIDQGVPKERAFGLIKSRNTVDEILAIRELCEKLHWRHIAIVTSEFHMPRVMMLSAVARIPARVDYRPSISPMQNTLFLILKETGKIIPTLMWVRRRMRRPLEKFLLNRSVYKRLIQSLAQSDMNT